MPRPPLGCVRVVGNDEAEDVFRAADEAVKTVNGADELLTAFVELLGVGVDEVVEHCEIEVAGGRTSVPFIEKETSAQSLMLRLFVA